MGAALRRTSFSPNIKERRDYSCAVFDSAGQVIAMGDHMPVHLGSMPMSVAAAVKRLRARTRRRRHAQRSLPRWHPPPRHHAGDAGVLKRKRQEPARGAPAPHNARLLRRFPRPPRRCRRNLPRLHGPLPRNLPGRPPHSAGQNHARRKTRRRCAGPPAQQRPHARRTRRRPRRSDRRLPDRSPAPSRNLRTLRNRPCQESRRRSARLFRRNDARLSAHHPARPLPGRRFSR